MDANNTGASTTKNGIIWKTRYSNNSSYTKTSAGVFFQPEDDYFRGGLAFYTNGTANASTNATEKMRIDRNGNVGIGTTTPDYPFEINGTNIISGNPAAAGATAAAGASAPAESSARHAKVGRSAAGSPRSRSHCTRCSWPSPGGACRC